VSPSWFAARRPPAGGAPASPARREAAREPRALFSALSVWEAAALAVLGLALVARLRGAFVLLPLSDFDAAGHALNALRLYEGRLPELAAWLGFHPPLYYALGALAWHVLPDAVPVHAELRIVSTVAGFAALAVAFPRLRRVVGPADAAVLVALAGSLPGFAASAGSMGNETLCAAFATAALSRLVDLGEPGPRHALATGALAGLAALSKATGLLVVAVSGLAYLVALRRTPRRALAAAAALALAAALLAGPHYARILVATGRPLAVVSGAGASPDMRHLMERQPPGERHLADYLRIPASTWLHPVLRDEALLGSVPGLLYAASFADALGVLLPLDEDPQRLAARRTLAFLGLVPSLLFATGLVLVLRRRALLGRVALPLLFAALLFAALLVYTWVLPFYSAVKPSYLLPALLPVLLLLGFGLAPWPARVRRSLRTLLLATAAAASLLTWPVAPLPALEAPAGEPGRLVGPAEPPADPGPANLALRYFELLARDPIRLLVLLTPEYHLEHGLRARPVWEETQPDADPGESGSASAAPLAERQIGWLTVLQAPIQRDLSRRLSVQVGRTIAEGNRAAVVTRVQAPGTPPFVQRFFLEHAGAGASWRVRSIEQRRVGPRNALAALVAAPDEKRRRELWLGTGGGPA
jgi:hypothetical protein